MFRWGGPEGVGRFFSGRKFLRNMGFGAAVGAAAPALRGFPLASATEAPRENFVGADQPARVATAADPVLLYRNENPYGPSERVLAVLLQSVARGKRYPRTGNDTLIGTRASRHHVK